MLLHSLTHSLSLSLSVSLCLSLSLSVSLCLSSLSLPLSHSHVGVVECGIPCRHLHGLSRGGRRGRRCCRRRRPRKRKWAVHERHEPSWPRSVRARGPPRRATLDRRRAGPPDSGAVYSWRRDSSGHCNSVENAKLFCWCNRDKTDRSGSAEGHALRSPVTRVKS